MKGSVAWQLYVLGVAAGMVILLFGWPAVPAVPLEAQCEILGLEGPPHATSPADLQDLCFLPTVATTPFDINRELIGHHAVAVAIARNRALAGLADPSTLVLESPCDYDLRPNLSARDGKTEGSVTAETHVAHHLVPHSGQRTATRGAAKVLAQPRMMNHHLFPQQFRKFFDKVGVKIDNFTVRISETTHLKGVHGRGVGDLPGGWNARWQQFIEANPNATAKDAFQFGGSLMDEFGLGGLPIIPFR